MFNLTVETIAAIAVVLLMMVGLLSIMGLFFMEAGLVRARNTNDLIIKNIALFALVAFAFILLSSHLELSAWTNYLPKVSRSLHLASATHFHCGMMLELIFLMFSLAIITGATAERLRFWPLILFSLSFLLFIYPIEVFWVWDSGFLKKLGFIDQAGASVVHINGAMAAFSGLLLIGFRRGRFMDNNESLPLPGANIPLAAMGASFIWIGFIALNLATVIYQPESLDSAVIFTVLTNTLLAGASGVLLITIFSRVIFGVVDLTLMFNGLLAGLTAITAAPGGFTSYQSITLACSAAVITMMLLYIFDKCRIDDPCGIIASQFIGGTISLIGIGVWNSHNANQLLIQCTGIICITIFSLVASYLFWWLVRLIIGLRIRPEDEYKGLDVTECGMVAYPEFTPTNWEK